MCSSDLASNAKYLNGLSAPQKAKILKAVAGHYGVSVREIEGELTDRDAEALYEYLAFDNGMAMQVYRDFKSQRLAAKTAAKQASYSLYGYRTKTATLGLNTCAAFKAEAGRIASDLHRRRADKHAHITGFLGEHCKQGRCMYARIIRDAYPDPDMRLASVQEPNDVGGWLIWED